MSFLGILCGGIAAIGGHWSINLLPFPGRYELEGDVGLAFAAVECSRYLSGRVLVYIAIIGSGAGCLQAARMFQFNRSFVRPIVIEKTPEYWCADWVNRHIPGQRVMISGDAEFWFNYFSDNPQMSGSHEPFSPNRAQQIAVFIIYSGLNAGSRDGEIAKTWLKAFGVTAISVPGNESLEPLHPFSRPDKFVGLLPSVASFAGDEMYSVPQRSSSLAHVIPNSAVVGQSPLNGLDTSLAEKYVAALDDPLLPMADMKWVNSGEAEIDATVGSNQVVSVQESYYPGWTAQLNGQPLRVDHDGLGLMLLRPPPGKCKIVLRFEGTHWRRSSLVLAQFALSGLLLASAWEFATERASGSGRTIRMG